MCIYLNRNKKLFSCRLFLSIPREYLNLPNPTHPKVSKMLYKLWFISSTELTFNQLECKLYSTKTQYIRQNGTVLQIYDPLLVNIWMWDHGRCLLKVRESIKHQKLND